MIDIFSICRWLSQVMIGAHLVALCMVGCTTSSGVISATTGAGSGSAGVDTPKDNKDNNVRATLVFSANRRLEMEPCGCSLGPMGGFEREWNYLTRLRETAGGAVGGGLAGALYQVSAGVTFLPKNPHPNEKPIYLKKLDLFIEGLNELGVFAVSPAAADFWYGREPLMNALKNAKFQLVSANLYSKASHKPLFAQYIELPTEPLPLVLTGITQSDSRVQTDGIEVVDPVKALRELLNSLPQRDRVWVIMAPVENPLFERMIKEFPEMHIVFGGPENALTTKIKQTDKNHLLANPDSEGRQLLQLTLHLTKPFTNFFSPTEAIWIRDTRTWWLSQYNELHSQFQKEKNPKKKLRIQKERDKYLDFVKAVANVPLEKQADSIVYEGQLPRLDASLAKPTNKMTKLLERLARLY